MNSRTMTLMHIAINDSDLLRKFILTKSKVGMIEFILENNNNPVTSADIARTKGIKRNWASMQLSELIDQGYLKRIKLKKGFGYVVVDSLVNRSWIGDRPWKTQQ